MTANGILPAHTAEPEPKPQELPPCRLRPEKECPGFCQYIMRPHACLHDCGGLECGSQPCTCDPYPPAGKGEQ